MTEGEISAASEELRCASAEDILRWAGRRFGERLTMATAFGAEGVCILHLLAKIGSGVRVFNLDTGYQFPETLAVRERIRERYGIEVEFVRPELTVAEYEAEHGGPLYGLRPDQCCHDRKIVPLRRFLAGFEAWISAIRRDQTTHRAKADVVQWDSKFGLAKVNPLLNWTKSDVWRFILENDIPYNPLHDQGYPSIGCWPCTASVAEGLDERAGRWAGTGKKECGLHVIEVKDGGGI
ncbi:MAG: phosphoadenylyl-sulfate reductase [Planctomycetia bacterium]|nr:phosphoadenylyl-sulfate reductase [Planctomycetia bacterium]